MKEIIKGCLKYEEGFYSFIELTNTLDKRINWD
jgi:hypothetical protein